MDLEASTPLGCYIDLCRACSLVSTPDSTTDTNHEVQSFYHLILDRRIGQTDHVCCALAP